MADVFISYSRHDSSFVHRLHDALKAEGREVWVDFEDIPPSAQWMNEIHAAIEAAEAFVYIITPHSAASTVCAEEVAHALQQNKRLIPVMREDVDQSRLPKSVCERNWIFCRESDDLAVAVTSLQKAIDTDLDWVRTHTRLLTRAIEWDNHGRDKSFALRGNDLQDAERCLAVNDKEPRLSALQVEYILGSRREEHNRRYRTIGATGVAVTVLMVIATMLAFKYKESERNLARDFREKGMTELANADPLEAELYFARSLSLDDTPEARQFLLQARAKSARLSSVSVGPAGSAVIAAAADGALFALKAKDYISLRDATGREVTRIPDGDDRMFAAFSPDGRKLAVAGAQSIEIWPVTGNVKSAIASFDAPGTTNLVFDPSGHSLVSGSNDGTLTLWALKGGSPEPMFQVRGHHAQVSALAFSPDGRFLASGSWDNDIELWSVAPETAAGDEGGFALSSTEPPLKALHKLEGHDDAVLSLAFSPEGQILASGGWDNRILLWDRDSGRQLREFLGHNGGVLSLAFSPQGDLLASGSEDRVGRVWQVLTGRPLLQLPGPRGNVTAVTFFGAQAPHQLAVGDKTGSIRVWDLDTIGQRDELATLYGHRRPVKALAFHPKGGQLASGSWDRTVRLWNLKNRTARLLRADGDAGPDDSVTMVNYSADGTRLVSASKDGAVRLWDLSIPSVQVLKPQTVGDPPIVRDVSFSPDARLIASGSDDGRIRIWSVADGGLTREFEVDPGAKSPKKVLTVVFSPDGRLLATSGEDGIVRLWRTTDWSSEATLVGHTDEVWQLAFARDGGLLFSASDDRTARIWDVAAHRQVGKPLEHAGPVWSVDIAADNGTLATASSDGTVHIWTLEGADVSLVATHRAVLRLSDDPVWVIAFNHSADAPQLAIGGVDRAIRIVDVARVRTLFDDGKLLEAEAMRGSGLQISDTTDYPIVPLVPTR